MSPKVSVVVAVYNVSQYIEQCVRSLFSQTLEDLEFIFVDDKSRDGSMDIVREVLKEYPDREQQVRMFFHKENQGVAATKNEGIENATGEYLAIVDPDDYIEANMMEEMYREAENKEADIVICDYYRFGDEPESIETSVAKGRGDDGNKIKDDILNRRRPTLCIMRLIRLSLFHKEVEAWPVGRYAEDIVYSTVTTYYAQRIAYVNNPLYHYRIHTNSLAHALSEEQRWVRYYGYMENVNIMEDFMKKVGCEEQYWKGILIHKVRTRNQLLPIGNKWKYRKLWFQTYPEINKMLFWGDEHYHSTYKEKIWFIVVALGLYPYCKKYLGKNKMKPFRQWPVW